MKRLPCLVIGLLLFCAGADAAKALSIVARDFDQLVARADTVFKGAVTEKKSLWVGEGETRHVATRVTFRVEETYKGEPAAEQTLEFFGGTVGEETMLVADMPQFEIGQNAVLFVVNNGRQFCPLVGITQGRFRVVKEEATGLERVFTDDQSPVVNTAEIGKLDAAGVPRLKRYAGGDAQPMAAEDFKSEILGKLNKLKAASAADKTGAAPDTVHEN